MDLPKDRRLQRIMAVGIGILRLNPVLRNFLTNELPERYHYWCQTYSINKLTYDKVEENDILKSLNFKNINKNHLKVSDSDYDYNVKCVKDFANLFLPSFVNAKNLSTFVECLDVHAILQLLAAVEVWRGDRLIPKVALFDKKIQAVAIEVRKNIRNKLAHNREKEWTKDFFNNCCTKMKELVDSLWLRNAEKEATIDQLDECKAKGTLVITISFIGLSLLFNYVSVDYTALFLLLLQHQAFDSCFAPARLLHL